MTWERQRSLVQEQAPSATFAQSGVAAFAKPFFQTSQLAEFVGDKIFPGLSTEESRKTTAENLSNINEILSDPRQGGWQQASNTISGMIGSFIPTLPLGLVGGAIAKGISSTVGFGARYLAAEAGSDALLSGYLATQVPLKNLATEAAGHFLPPFSLATAGEKTLEGYLGYKGFVIPEHFSENYNAVNNTLDANHAIQDWGADNYGFALAAAPLAAGYILSKGIKGIIALRGAKATKANIALETARLHKAHEETLKANKILEGEKVEREAKVSELQDHLQHAEDEGLITPEYHQWYLDYLENPNDLKVHEGGLNILKSLQIPYDRVTGRVWNQVLSRDGVKNMQSAIFDQTITNFSADERQLLSSYVIHNELDAYIGNMRENPNLLSAMDGMTHILGDKIEKQSLAIKEFDHAITRHLPQGLLKKQIFSQNNIYQHLKKIGVYSRTEVPYHVPKSVSYMLKLEKQIKKIEAKKTRQYELKYEAGKHLELKAKVKELKRQLLHPAEELMDLREKLMPEGNLRADYKNRASFHRLEDLAQVWPNAQVLLDRINMEAINAKQKGLNEVIKKFVEMVDVNASRLANPESVKRYLQSRIERSVPVSREFERSGIKFEPNEVEIKSQESNLAKELSDQAVVEQVRETVYEHGREYFDAIHKKFKQFNENTDALDELIKCALGEL